MALDSTDSEALKGREKKLKKWVFDLLGVGSEANWEAVSGDASFRRYFRVVTDRAEAYVDRLTGEETVAKRWIAVDAPPDKENNGAFVDILQRLTDAGIEVPKRIATDLDKGFLLLSDLGDQLLLPNLNDSTVDKWYSVAMQLLLPMQRCASAGLPPYDQVALRDEMLLFERWFLPKYLEIKVDADVRERLREVYTKLESVALTQPQCFVHRDYHPRNLMLSLTEEDSLSVIDFQDAVVGPITYDLVSLLKNSYKKWPLDRVDTWSLQFRELLIANNRITEDKCSVSTWNRWFDWMGMQRHIKVAGIFARLCYRDGKSGYLADIPRTVSFIVEMTERYPDEFGWFDNYLKSQVIPGLIERNPRAKPLFANLGR